MPGNTIAVRSDTLAQLARTVYACQVTKHLCLRTKGESNRHIFKNNILLAVKLTFKVLPKGKRGFCVYESILTMIWETFKLFTTI